MSTFPRGVVEVMERLRELVAALQLSDELPQLADLARVPESKQEDFREVILSLLCDTWIRESRLQLTSKNLALSRAAAELRSARQALADLDERDREALSRQISAVENGIDEFLLLAIGESRCPGCGNIAAEDARARSTTRCSCFRAGIAYGRRSIGWGVHNSKEHWNRNCDQSNWHP